MKTQRVYTSALLLVLLAFVLCFTVPNTACAAGDRALTGELVVTNAARNQFRLVEHNGTFTAPAGVSVTELDGKPVRVEFGSDGRALQITQMPIDYAPITHGFEVVSGEFVLRDPISRTFGVYGDNRTFTIPQGVDPALYAGHLVELRLDDQGHLMSINGVTRAADAPQSPRLGTCVFGDASVVNGTSICRGGQMLRCSDGMWANTGTPCR